MATGGGRGATTSAFWTTLCRMVAVASSFSSSRAAGSAARSRCRWARRAGRPCASSPQWEATCCRRGTLACRRPCSSVVL